MLGPIDSSSQNFLLALGRLDERLDRAQQQVSSGKRIAAASDSPDQISELLGVRSEIARNQQIQTDLAGYQVEANVAGNALEQASRVMENVKSLISTGLNGTLAPSVQADLVNEVEGFMQDMLGIASTQVNGRYIFSGDRDTTAPYTIDLANANGVSAYAGAGSTRTAQHPDGASFAIAKTADDIFDSPVPGASV